MNFIRGDFVVHQNFGVGTVKTIETMNVGEERRLFYRVDFGEKTSVWVPVSDLVKRGVRPITPKNDLVRYKALLKSTPEPLEQDFRKRQIELEKRMQAGTFQSLCLVVRDMTAHYDKKPFSSYDRKIYRRSCDSLISEWSISSGKTLNDVQVEIEGYLNRSEGFLSKF
jgi:RNA polymerase-interacting CarD/CdnL/TRCF family regulator